MRLAAAAMALAFSVTAAAQVGGAPVAETEAGHLVGDPEAEVTLTEFMSYTCPSCGNFAKQAANALHLVYAGTGSVAVEYRPMVRDPVDLTVAMLVSCVPAERFAAAHATFMERQDGWLFRAQNTPAAQRQVWRDATGSAERRRSIASALEFYSKVEPLGLSRIEADRCLADQAQADKLLAAAEASRAEFPIPGTPSFALNGELLEDVHSWEALRPRLDAAVEAAD